MTKSEYARINNVIKLCASYYNMNTFLHCLRVANYAAQSVLVTDSQRELVFEIALCHDLMEDTEVTVAEICKVMECSKDFIEDVMGSLTKRKDESYIEYIERLKTSHSVYPYIVKLADMKDHLMQKDTLTQKLKDKYYDALPHLL